MKSSKKKKQGIGSRSFIVSGIVVSLIPSVFYVILGDFNYLLRKCTMPFEMVNIGNNVVMSCTELRFISVLSYFCILFGLILIVWGLIKKLKIQLKSK